MDLQLENIKQPDITDNGKWRVYRLLGSTFVSDFTFINKLTSVAETSPDVVFTCTDKPPLVLNWEHVTPIYTSPYCTDGEKSVVYLYHLHNCGVLRFTHVTDFYLWPDCIVCHLLNEIYAYMVEIRLLGPVLAFWLEHLGMPVLHASAVAFSNGAIGFLSTNKGGKSSLAAALMQVGCELLTDDILPLQYNAGEFLGQPGYPTMRMWPDEAQHFLGGYETLDLVHPELTKRRVFVGEDGFGTFCAEPQPLIALYLPERRDPTACGTAVEITPLPPRNAVMALVRHSFVARLVQAAGLQPQRLDFFARLVARVPVYHLRYPSGFAYLPYARDALLEHIRSL